eukprot:1417725-Pyramimonas_sp.AAC.1
MPPWTEQREGLIKASHNRLGETLDCRSRELLDGALNPRARVASSRRGRGRAASAGGKMMGAKYPIRTL